MKIQFVMKVLACVTLLCLSGTTMAPAGQLVTEDQRQWASQAVRQEQALAAIQKPKTVAVLYFRNQSDQPELDMLQKGLTLMLISDLAKLDLITVIERTELQALLEELGFGRSGLVDPGSAPRVGRLLQAEHLIGGAFAADSPKALRIGVDVLETASGRSVGRAEADGPLDNIMVLQKQLLAEIVHALKLDLSPAQKARLETPLSRDPEALLALFKAIEAGDQGQYAAAAEHYDRALLRDPGLSIAQRGLQQLVSQGLAPLPYGLQRRALLRKTRQRTSFTTGLAPSLPVSRLRHPVAVAPEDSEQIETDDSLNETDDIIDDFIDDSNDNFIDDSDFNNFNDDSTNP